MSAPPRPAGVAETLFIVVRPSGERHYLDKETHESVLEWAKGTDVTILEYKFAGVIRKPSPKPPASKPDAT